jgi:GNAT superfamily N-acetyltransferase
MSLIIAPGHAPHPALVHVIVDIHRHAGHADLLRELIDGAVGTDRRWSNLPPGDAAWWASTRPEQVDEAQISGLSMWSRCDTGGVIRSATKEDFAAIVRLYAQLHPEDPPVTDGSDVAAFDEILSRPGLELVVLEVDGDVVATTYLNVIPNLTRSAQPYAVIENVVVDEKLRGTGLGRRLMDATLDRAWTAGCYKAMLLTGSKNPNTHAFYRASGFSPDAKAAYLARP